MKISVAVITYNQQDTIAQTLDSILCQKGDFELEVVVGEDCSTDNTLAICQEYAERYPEQIVLLSGPQNLGITANYFRTLKACTGNFIGDIAGDDFYCDEHALEKQKNYLLSHPEVGVLGANGYRYYVRRNVKEEGLNPVILTATDDKAKEFYFSQNYQGGVYIKPIGIMMRREMLQYIDYDEMLRRKLPVEDYPMQAIWSQYTKFACLPDLLVTYRIYSESATFVSLDHPKYLEYHKGLMDTRRYLNELFPNDTCFTETGMQDYEFYKEFLFYLHRKQYNNAKQLLNKYKHIAGQPHYTQAKRFTRSWVHFIGFHYYKEYAYKKQLEQQV
jgi:glycosyltransferase involved in cell wall biosynthesis